MLQDQEEGVKDGSGFSEKVIESEIVWGLEGADGFAWCESNEQDDCDVLVFWSDESSAELARKENYPDYKLTEISLFDFLFRWLTGMAEDEVFVGVDWSSELIGDEIDADSLKDSIFQLMSEPMVENYKEKLGNLLEQDDN